MATRQETQRTTGAVALGVIGGILGIIAGFLGAFIGGVGVFFQPAEGAQMIGLGFLTAALGVIAIIGGGLTVSKPQAGAIIMAISGVVGFFFFTLFWILPGALMIIGAILAWQSEPRQGMAQTA